MRARCSLTLSPCVHFVALRIASLGGWSGGGAVGDVWCAGHFTCLLGLGGGAPLGGSLKFPHQAGTAVH